MKKSLSVSILFLIPCLLFAQAENNAVENSIPTATILSNSTQNMPPIENKVFKKQKKNNEEMKFSESKKNSEDFSKDREHDKYDFLSQIDYPELQVVPRATERLQTESQGEDDAAYQTYWPIEVSGLVTAYVGYLQKGNYKEAEPSLVQKSKADGVALLGQGTGLAWLGIGLFLGYKKPYNEALNRIKKVKTGNKRNELYRERVAEEEMEKQHDLALKMNLFSVISNSLVSVALLERATPSNERWAATALLTSFLPLFFENKYVINWQKQQEYKRKIYAPVSQLGIGVDIKNYSYYPEMQLHWYF